MPRCTIIGLCLLSLALMQLSCETLTRRTARDPAGRAPLAVKATREQIQHAWPTGIKKVPGSFSIVILPDTQFYSEDDPETYFKQTQWIVDHADDRDIRFVIHMGDITNSNTEAEWEVASRAHATLEGNNTAGRIVPYSVLPGNHDFPKVNDARIRNAERYNEHFGPHRFASDDRPWYGGHHGDGNENNYCTFDVGYLKFLVVSLEYAARKDALTWAEGVISAHPDHRVIVATHAYTAVGGERLTEDADGQNIIGSEGETIFEEFARRHSNIFMVLSGHISDSEHRDVEGLAHNTIHEVLTDYQSEERDGHNHGNGWLRVMEFHPADNRIDVTTLSVLSDVSAFNHVSVYSASPSASDHTFSLDYTMNSPTPPAYTLTDTRARFHDRTIHRSEIGGNRQDPSIAMDGSGGFVVAWEDDEDGNGYYQIKARGFDDFGNARFSDITVNGEADGQQLDPDVGVDAAGHFVAVWADDRDGNGHYQILARGFNPDGSGHISEFTVNSASDGDQLKPAIAMNSGGDFVVVWEDDLDGNGFYQIMARGFKPDGSVRFNDIVVNEVSDGQQLKPDVAIDSEGNFVVVWEDDSDGNGFYQIRSRRFNANGSPRSGDVTVNTVSDGQQRRPVIAMDPGGDYVVVWEDDSNDNNVYQVHARGFGSDGTERFGETTVNKIASGQQLRPAVAMDSAEGLCVVAWQDDDDANGYYEIRARALTRTGSEHIDQFTVNSDSRDQQRNPVVGFGTLGRFVIVWEDNIDAGSVFHIVGRGLSSQGK